MLLNVNASVAIIGMSVKARNPTIKGAMNTYPQRARRQASPDRTGHRRRERWGTDVIGGLWSALVPDGLELVGEVVELAVEIEVGRGLPFRAEGHDEVERLVVGRHVRLEVRHVRVLDALLRDVPVDRLREVLGEGLKE